MRFFRVAAFLSRFGYDLFRIKSRHFLLRSVVGLVALLAAGPAFAEVAGPGWLSGTAEAVSPEAARAYYDALSAAAPVSRAAALEAPLGPQAAAVAPETLPEIVALARALVLQPALLLADEPTGNLDERTSEEIHELLFRINRERQITAVVVTHNTRLAARMPRKLVMMGGIIGEAATDQSPPRAEDGA